MKKKLKVSLAVQRSITETRKNRKLVKQLSELGASDQEIARALEIAPEHVKYLR